MKPIELNDNNLKSSISSNKTILVNFFSSGCPTCRSQLPIIDTAAEKYSDKVTFAKINVDENEAFLNEYMIISVPTFILFDNDEKVKKISGLQNEEKLTEFISEYI